jgi:hypothetical protein
LHFKRLRYGRAALQRRVKAALNSEGLQPSAALQERYNMQVATTGNTSMPLSTDTKKVMFEIYREADFTGQYKVVYFTELGEHDKETEIENAMRGQHIFDGFLLHRERNQAKQVVDELLDRMNRGESVDETVIKESLQPFLA